MSSWNLGFAILWGVAIFTTFHLLFRPDQPPVVNDQGEEDNYPDEYGWSNTDEADY